MKKTVKKLSQSQLAVHHWRASEAILLCENLIKQAGDGDRGAGSRPGVLIHITV